MKTTHYIREYIICIIYILIYDTKNNGKTRNTTIGKLLYLTLTYLFQNCLPLKNFFTQRIDIYINPGIPILFLTVFLI